VSSWLRRFSDDIEGYGQERPDVALPEPPERLAHNFNRKPRVLHQVPDLSGVMPKELSVVRAEIAEALHRYAETEAPSWMFVLRALAGVGKTTAAVRLAQEWAAAGKRVIYMGPRHDFFQELMLIRGVKPGFYYEWLPRQREDRDKGKVETCAYAEEISSWLHRGYKAMDFCIRVCGGTKGCPYHEQRKRQEPIVYAQHQHCTMGHPLMDTFHLAIGDEYPLEAFQLVWYIPGKWIVPPGMDVTEDLTEVLQRLASLAHNDGRASGHNLLDFLGGPERVLDACEAFSLPENAILLTPEIRDPRRVEEVPYAHLPILAPLLAREARAALAYGADFVNRVIVANKGLTLYLRRPVNPETPRRLIWLDATAHPRIYEALFGREVEFMFASAELRGRLYQVTDRANGKGSLVTEGKKGEMEATHRVDQAETLVKYIVERRGYRSPSIVTYKDLVEGNPEANLEPNAYFASFKHLHFYAARGSNSLEDCDALFVLGTPQPSLEAMQNQAAIIFHERDRGFAREWTVKGAFEEDDPPAYNWVDEKGQVWGYPTSGYWQDPDLQAVLWSSRDAEIIQAVYRARPVTNRCDVWILSNIPMVELPLARLMSVAEIYGAPDEVDYEKWHQAMVVAEELAGADAEGQVDLTVLAERTGIHRDTLRRWTEYVVATGKWEVSKIARAGRGQPRSAWRRVEAEGEPEE
jgi:hypothetical protein